MSLSGGGSSEILIVESGVTAKISGLTLVDGLSGKGGAVDNSSALTLCTCVLAHNDADGNSTTAGAGGAIDNETGATLKVFQSRFARNLASDGVISGGNAVGGAIFDAAASRSTIRGTTFVGNQVDSNEAPNGVAFGGAIGNTKATLIVMASRFVGNKARGFSLGQSGAINNQEGTTSIAGTTFRGNQAIGTGAGGFAASGAITNVGAQPFSTSMNIIRSRLIDNRAVATAGGDGVNTLSAAFGGAMGTSGAGVIVRLGQSILAGNRAMAATPARDADGIFLAGIAVGGAIENDTQAVFHVAHSTIRNNRAIGGRATAVTSGGSAFGGGIGDFMSQAAIQLMNTVVTGNLARGGGPGGDGLGGGIAVFQQGVASLTRTRVSWNRASTSHKQIFRPAGSARPLTSILFTAQSRYDASSGSRRSSIG